MRILFVVIIAGLVNVAGAWAQADSALAIPAARYAPGSWLHETMLGDHYRDLWATPIPVPVLDLGKFAGGLTPVRVGGSLQTVSLRFQAADGREYNFRSVDKELTPAMPEFAQETFVDWIRQDQTSAQLPSAPIIATSLLDAVGILNPAPRLMVMPDDPRLGEFREQFAGMLGTMEVHADEGDGERRLFADAAVVAGTDRLLEHLEEDLDHRVDSRAFLKARLMDVFLGDYDRHGGQWRWAQYERQGLKWWVPVPEDRDYAFVAYDGLLLDLGRRIGVRRLIVFDDEYPDLLHMVDNSLALTRYLVADLTWEDWAGVVAELETALTDEAIREAVETLPAPHFELHGDDLIRQLRARRDQLRSIAMDFYRLLAHVVEVHATDADDRLVIDRRPDGQARVRLFAGGEEPARYQRLLDPEITRQIRVFLEGGEDEAVVQGSSDDIEVHVIGGGGDDTFVDESSGPTGFYDDRGENRFLRGPGTFVDERPWEAPPMIPEDDDPAEEAAAEEGPTEGNEGEDAPADAFGAPPSDGAGSAPSSGNQPGTGNSEETSTSEEDAAPEEDAADILPGLERDWGRGFTFRSVHVGWEGHAELVLGIGPRLTDFGYRYAPYEARYWLRGLYAPLSSRVGVEGGADLRRIRSTGHLTVHGRFSNLEATVLNGFGNDSPADGRVRIWHTRAHLDADVHVADSGRVGLSFGPTIEYIDPEEGALGGLPLSGSALEPTTRFGARLRGRFDTRDGPVFPRSGVFLSVEGSTITGGVSNFARAEVDGTAIFPLPIGALSVRGGVRGVAGEYKYYDAVFIGGSETLRGHRFQRFAGDRAAFAGGTLHLPIARMKLLLRGTLGASLFADAGRVWFEGDSPDGWHTGAGGGVWFQIPIGAVSVSYARGEEDRFYFRFGLPR